MYNAKKAQSQERIKKKAFKIEEYDRILMEEVEPKFEELKKDKEVWEQFKNLELEIDQKQKLSIAYCFAMTTQQL